MLDAAGMGGMPSKSGQIWPLGEPIPKIGLVCQSGQKLAFWTRPVSVPAVISQAGLKNPSRAPQNAVRGALSGIPDHALHPQMAHKMPKSGDSLHSELSPTCDSSGRQSISRNGMKTNKIIGIWHISYYFKLSPTLRLTCTASA